MGLNPLGDLRAEYDHQMLDSSFYEMAEYRSILEDDKSYIVVGRRGTGKSALFYKLQQYWTKTSHNFVIELIPNETEIIGLRYFIDFFGTKPSYLRAAVSKAWEYALLNEIISRIAGYYKVTSDKELEHLTITAQSWNNRGNSILEKLYKTLEERVNKNDAIEKRIADLATKLNVKSLKIDLKKAFTYTNFHFYIIADRLDEGYAPDPVGVSILTGLIYALNNLTNAINNLSSIMFIRDNIFRAIQKNDPDYSRNIEGNVLRIHWEEYTLFTMICKRIKSAFNIKPEKDLKIWTSVTSGSLKSKDNFRQCLKLTLYRPRDLILLLNRAFNKAISSDDNYVITKTHIDSAASEISYSRLDDLKKEYSEIIPGLISILHRFVGKQAKMSLPEMIDVISPIFEDDSLDPITRQLLAILENAENLVRSLYSIGFLGIWHPSINSFVFCHDGKDPDLQLHKTNKILIHPCYWIALNLTSDDLDQLQAEQINDEYDIKISSETPKIRKKKLGQLISRLDSIQEGKDQANDFEEWCLEAVRIVFAPGLSNIEHHPNKDATQRRDIIGTNTEETPTWKRILTDFSARQVLFEVKNYSSHLKATEYRQMNSYLTKEHGSIGFIINRSADSNLEKGSELDWVREIYQEHNKIIIKLPAKEIAKWLGKLRNPQKHDEADKKLGHIIDRYQRLYLKLCASP